LAIKGSGGVFDFPENGMEEDFSASEGDKVLVGDAGTGRGAEGRLHYPERGWGKTRRERKQGRNAFGRKFKDANSGGGSRRCQAAKKRGPKKLDPHRGEKKNQGSF